MRTIHAFLLMLCFPFMATANVPDLEQIDRALADEQFKHVVELLTPQVKALSENADMLHRLARAHWSLEQFDEAQDYIDTVLELRQDHYEDYYLAGRIYSNRVLEVSIFKKLSYAKRIRKYFERCIELDPQSTKARLALMLFHINAPGIAGGSSDEAEALAQQLADIGAVPGLRAAVLLALADDDNAKAMELTSEILSLKNDDVSAQYLRGTFLVGEERYDEAMPILRHVGHQEIEDIDERRQQRGAWYQIGKAASESGQWLDEGRMILERYLTLSSHRGLPSKAWAYYRLSLIHDGLKDLAKAKEYLALADDENDGDDDELDDLLDDHKKELKRRKTS